jgi:hypothetical protein
MLNSGVPDMLHYQIEKLSADIIEEDRIDKSWSMISQIKRFDGKPKFSELANLMLGILVILLYMCVHSTFCPWMSCMFSVPLKRIEWKLKDLDEFQFCSS